MLSQGLAKTHERKQEQYNLFNLSQFKHFVNEPKYNQNKKVLFLIEFQWNFTTLNKLFGMNINKNDTY